MGEERLTGLATMTIHRYIHLDVSDIIDRFASTQRKKYFCGCKSHFSFLFSIKNIPF